MKLRLRLLFWVETGLAAITGILCVITPIWPDWIEAVSGWTLTSTTAPSNGRSLPGS